jgi:hypothetical protein
VTILEQLMHVFFLFIHCLVAFEDNYTRVVILVYDKSILYAMPIGSLGAGEHISTDVVFWHASALFYDIVRLRSSASARSRGDRCRGCVVLVLDGTDLVRDGPCPLLLNELAYRDGLCLLL